MKDARYEIQVAHPRRPRRGDYKKDITVINLEDGHAVGNYLANINDDKTLELVARRIAKKINEPREKVEAALLQGLLQLKQVPPPRPSRNGNGNPPLPSTPVQHEGDREVIQTNGRFMRDITADSVKILDRANNPPRLFSRGSELVRLALGGELQAEPLSTAGLKGELDRAADFVKVKSDEDGNDMQGPDRPPDDVVADILALQELPFPKLKGFATTPVFVPGGRLLARDGYDPDSGLYLRMDGLKGLRCDMPLRTARNLLLDDLLGDFPFKDHASRAHALSAVLQPFVRYLIPGATPNHHVDAPTPGTGKGLLVDLISYVSTGRPAQPMKLPENDDEVDKRITSALIAGHRIILFDNVRYLGSEALEVALTTTVYRGRILGKSQIVDAPNTALWLTTGNNVEFSDEMNRRTVGIGLDAQVEDPETRTGWKHPLPSWAIEHRTELVSACLSVVQLWVKKGMPPMKDTTLTLGRFEEWASIMGGIQETMGVPGFLKNLDDQKHADTETQEWMALCKSWWSKYAERPITAKDVFDIVKEKNLLLDVWAGRSAISAQQRVGRALRRRKDRRYEDFYIRAAGVGETGNHSYRLQLWEGGKKTPESQETPQIISEETHFSGGVSGVDGKNTPEAGGVTGVLGEHQEQNTSRISDTDSGVSGVSGVSYRPEILIKPKSFQGSCQCLLPEGEPVAVDGLPNCPICNTSSLWCPDCGGCRRCRPIAPAGSVDEEPGHAGGDDDGTTTPSAAPADTATCAECQRPLPPEEVFLYTAAGGVVCELCGTAEGQ